MEGFILPSLKDLDVAIIYQDEQELEALYNTTDNSHWDYLLNKQTKNLIINNESLVRKQYENKEKIFNWLFDAVTTDDYLDSVFGKRKSTYLLVSPQQKIININGKYYNILFSKRSTDKNKITKSYDTFYSYKKILNPCYTYYVDYFKHQVSHNNVTKIRAFVVDIDFVLASDAMKISMALKQGAFPIQPSYLINSGTGIHFVFNIQNQVNYGYTYVFDKINTALQDMVITTLKNIGVFSCVVDRRPITQAYRFPGTTTKLRGINVKAYKVNDNVYTVKYLARHLYGIYSTSAYRLLYSCSLRNLNKFRSLHKNLVSRLGYDTSEFINSMRISGWNTMYCNKHLTAKLNFHTNTPEDIIYILENTMQEKSENKREVTIGELWYGKYHKDDNFLFTNKNERRKSRFAYFVSQNEKNLQKKVYNYKKQSENVIDFVKLKANSRRQTATYYIQVAVKEDLSDAKIYGVKVSFMSKNITDDFLEYTYRKNIKVENIWVALDKTKKRSYKSNKLHIDKILKNIHLLVQDEEYLIYNDRKLSDLRDTIFKLSATQFKDMYGEVNYYYDLLPFSDEVIPYDGKVGALHQLPNAHENFFYGLVKKLNTNLPYPGFRNKTFFILGVVAYKTKRHVEKYVALQAVNNLYKLLHKHKLTVNFSLEEAIAAFESGYNYRYSQMTYKQIASWLGWKKTIEKKKVIKSSKDRSRLASLHKKLKKYAKLHRILRLLSTGLNHKQVRNLVSLSNTTYFSVYRKDTIMQEFIQLSKVYKDRSKAFNSVLPMIKRVINEVKQEITTIYNNRDEIIVTKYMPQSKKEKVLPTRMQSITKLTKNTNELTKCAIRQVKARKTVKQLCENTITYHKAYIKFFDNEVMALINSSDFFDLVDKKDKFEMKRYFKWKREMKKCWEEHKDDWIVKLYDGLSKEVDAYIYDEINPILNKAIRESAKAPSKEERDKILKKANKRVAQIRSDKRREILLKRLESLIETDKIDDFLLDKKQILRYIYN